MKKQEKCVVGFEKIPQTIMKYQPQGKEDLCNFHNGPRTPNKCKCVNGL
jgi:hypothetical protein